VLCETLKNRHWLHFSFVEKNMKKSLLTFLGLVALSTTIAQNQYPTNGLRGLYELDNNFANAVSTNFALSASLSGANTANFTADRTSAANKAFNRYSSSSFYNQTLTDNLTDFSMGAWVKLQEYTDGANLFSTVMSDLNYFYDESSFPLGTSGYFTIRIDGSGIVQAILIGGGPSPVYTVLNSTDPLSLNEWHQITWTVDQTNQEARLFIDGVQVAFADGLVSPNNPSDFYLGNVMRVNIVQGTPNPAPWQIFTGVQDEVFVYERVLDSCEVKRISELIPTISISATTAQLSVTQVNNATYQWFNCSNDQAVSGANQATFIPADNATYYAVVTANCVNDTTSCLALLPNTSGVDELENAVVIAPNPANENLTISGIDLVSVKVIDATGRVILEQTSSLIETSALSNGIYTLIVKDHSSRTVSKRFMVQH
jgi:hypothetical protein